MRPDVTLIGAYPPRGARHGGSSGVASYTANLAHALAERGAEVAVVAAQEDGDPSWYRDGPVTVHRAFDRGARALPAAAQAAAVLGAPVSHVQFEVFLYGGASALAGVPLGLRALRTRAATVSTVHQVVDPRGVDRGFTELHRVRVPAPLARVGLGGLQRGIARLVDRVIVHEPAFASILPGAAVIPHGVELANGPPREAARRAFGLDDGRLTVLCFGFVAPYKGIEAAMAACALVADEVELVVAGGEHPRLAGRERYIDHLQARWPDVARFTGFVEGDEVASWFTAADVALFAYPRPFSSSGALALALAHDTPVLLSPELAAATGAPGLATPTDPLGLASTLRSLATDRAALGELSAATRSLGAGREWPAVAAAHLHLYEEVKHATHAPRGRLRAGEPR